MPVLLLCGCFLLLWHHTLLQRLPWWLPANDQCPQGGTAPLPCRWLTIILSTLFWKMLNYSEGTWLKKIGDTLSCPFYHRAQRQAAGGYWVSFTCGSPTNGGGVRPGLWGLQKCPHFLNNKTLLKTSLATVISAYGWSRGMKLSSCMVKSPGHWTKFLLCPESPQVCSPADISTQALLWARAVAPLDSK